ncbi:hypothetical protein M513_08618 [Trichuris suis]|uniref:Uncharacterized protein n=1 Tax=Trichuris suis TaxID=68888 RepID=A0A085M004_9BILA|nr:hypothetical protein M513_08618 [Trichuris suis]
MNSFRCDSVYYERKHKSNSSLGEFLIASDPSDAWVLKVGYIASRGRWEPYAGRWESHKRSPGRIIPSAGVLSDRPAHESWLFTQVNSFFSYAFSWCNLQHGAFGSPMTCHQHKRGKLRREGPVHKIASPWV